MRTARRRGILAVIVQRLLGRADPSPRCPKCGDDRLVEWDGTLAKFICDVCAHQWRPLPPRAAAR